MSVAQAADTLGVPWRWLEAEVKAGKIPSVRAGRRVLVHLDRARAVLEARAAGEGVSS